MKEARPLVEQTPSIDIRELDRLGWLEPGASFKFFGTKPRLDDGSFVEMNVDPLGHTVYVRVLAGDRSGAQRFELVRQSCNLGGMRRWFRCAQCARRVAVLYVLSGEIACRCCHGLAYESQRPSARDRPLVRAQRRRLALNGSACMAEPFPDKPGHMRWRVYFKLQEQDLKDQEAWLQNIFSTRLYRT